MRRANKRTPREVEVQGASPPAVVMQETAVAPGASRVMANGSGAPSLARGQMRGPPRGGGGGGDGGDGDGVGGDGEGAGGSRSGGGEGFGGGSGGDGGGAGESGVQMGTNTWLANAGIDGSSLVTGTASEDEDDVVEGGGVAMMVPEQTCVSSPPAALAPRHVPSLN